MISSQSEPQKGSSPDQQMLKYAKKYHSWIPHGFDFMGPKETSRMEGLKTLMRQQFQNAGYAEVIPPTFDYVGTFQITARDAALQPIFRVRDADGENLSVRSDLTVQVIKAAASGRIAGKKPLRCSYLQPVFQDRSWGTGMAREVIQAGVELIGSDQGQRLPELLHLATNCIGKLDLEVHILYGDVRFLNRLFEQVPEQVRIALAAAFYNKDTSQISNICKESNINGALRDTLVETPLIFGKKEALAELNQLCSEDEIILEILKKAAKVENVIYDFSMVRELSYYTGPVFEAYTPGAGERILSGGIYDTLYEKFAGSKEHACGFALNLSLLNEFI